MSKRSMQFRKGNLIKLMRSYYRLFGAYEGDNKPVAPDKSEIPIQAYKFTCEPRPTTSTNKDSYTREALFED